MKVNKLSIPGALLIEPKVFGDHRGYFYEGFQAERYQSAGIPYEFVQDNFSLSKHGTLRGLHHQTEQTQGKLVWVIQGKVFDVIVDIRQGSPTFGQYESVILDSEQHQQVFVPPGCAHGFCTLSDTALFTYKCTDYYNPKHELSIRWDDPQLNIDWPLKENLTISQKDKDAQYLKDLPKTLLPSYQKDVT